MSATFHRNSPVCSPCAISGVLLALIASPAFAAWDRVDPVPLPNPAHFATQGLSPADDDGYWAFGAVDRRGAIARFGNDGGSRWLRYTDRMDQVIGVGDGEAVSTAPLSATVATGCALYRWAADGEQSWRVVLDYDRRCRTVVADGAGGAWVVMADAGGNQWARHVLADGVIHDEGAALNAFLGDHYELVADPGGGGLYAVGQRPSGRQAGARIDAAVVAIDRHGHLRWQRQVPSPDAQLDHRFEAATVARNGDLFVVGHAGAGGASTYLRVSSFRRSGETVVDRTFFEQASLDLPTVAIQPADAGAHVVAGDATRTGHAVFAFNIGTDGELRHPALQLDSFRITSPVQAAATRDGRRLLLVGLDGASPGDRPVLFVGDDGNLPLRIGPLEGTISGLTAPADGRAVLAHAADSDPRSASADLLRFDAAGHAAAPPDLEIGSVESTVVASRFGSDGAVYRVSVVPGTSDGLFEKIGADGRPAWRSRQAGVVADSSALLSVNAGRMCSTTTYQRGILLDCRDSTSGAPLFQRRFAEGYGAANGTSLEVLTAGDVLVFYFDFRFGRYHLVHLDSAGAELYDVVDTSSPRQVALGAGGGAAIYTSLEYPPHLRIYDPNGGVLIDRLIPGEVERLAPRLFATGDSGFVSTYLLSGVIDRGVASYADLLDARLGEVWSVRLPDELEVLDARIRDDAVVFLANDYAHGEVVLLSLARSDGQVRWRRPVATYVENFPTRFEIDPGTGDLAAVQVNPFRSLRVVTVSGVDGRVLVDRIEACGDSRCDLEAIGIDTDRHVRLLAATDGPSGARSDLYQLTAPFQPEQPPALDQPAIVGAWYPDYASGQGLMVDYLASSGLLYAPWFTFAPGRIDDPKGLRWYSLQGRVSPEASEADLDILENSGGRFAAPPGTTARRVGAAHLRLDDCRRMALDYAFDPGTQDARVGTMTLTRLTAPIAPCGTPGVSSAVHSAGTASALDPRLSGSWYAPSQSGQGFSFVFQPGRELFGAWLTYDPEGAADDPTAQQWLTLQGGSSVAPSAPLIATVYQTLGGYLDGFATRNTRRVGEVAVTVQACDRMTLDYRFDASDVAGAFAGRTGSLALQKIGGCSP